MHLHIVYAKEVDIKILTHLPTSFDKAELFISNYNLDEPANCNLGIISVYQKDKLSSIIRIFDRVD